MASIPKTVWKFKIDPCEVAFDVPLPKGARILHVYNGYLWCLVSRQAPVTQIEHRKFMVVGTGWDIDVDGFVYIGTYHQGEFVWHVFAESKPVPL